MVNYSSSAAPAEEVANEIKSSGGDAIVVGADISKPEGVEKCALARHSLCLSCLLCGPCVGGHCSCSGSELLHCWRAVQPHNILLEIWVCHAPDPS